MPTIYDKLSTHPVLFDPAFEIVGENERETAESLRDEMRTIAETTSKDYGFAVRTVHAKAHGVLVGELEVLGGLPEVLAQGVFAKAQRYPTVLRFSTNPGDILDDSVVTPRGLSIKLIGVEGERLPDSVGNVQDFVMVNGPVFPAKDPEAFLGNLKLLAATTDTPQIGKKIISAAFRTIETALEAVGTESATLKTLGGHRSTHILGETFYTAAPLRYGKYMAKLSIAPVSPNVRAMTDTIVPVAGRPDALREEVKDFFETNEAVYELRVQLLTDPESMPIEDASVEWPEDKSPYVPVARITVPRQDSWSEERARKLDEALAFSPWHGVEDHRPLGAIMRVRKISYEMSSAFREKFNGCPIHEPASRADIGV